MDQEAATKLALSALDHALQTLKTLSEAGFKIPTIADPYSGIGESFVDEILENLVIDPIKQEGIQKYQ